MVATALCLCACGPSAFVDRAEPGLDAGQQTPDAPMNPAMNPPIAPVQPPPSNQPPGQPIDPNRSPNGFACTQESECLSRHCADGICCDLACDGVCQACDQPGNGGRCLPVGQGQDPDDECPDEGATSCGRDGACDGASACRRYPADTVCAPGGCDNAIERAPRLCDGKGVCQPVVTKNCAPAMCIGDACAPPCVMDGDCPMGRYCDAGTCRTQREPGASCERATQCASGFCTDGVCCNMACKDACYSCNQQGAMGECKAVPDGQDPAAECRVQAIGTCGNGGGCNGRGACRKHPVGTWCGYGSCMNGTQFGDSTCDGMGGCRRGPGRSCGLYACNGNLVCWTVCANNAQCAPGRTCNIHTCQ